MRVPFVSFLPMEKELDKYLRAAFERVYTRSWYIEGVEDDAFETAFAEYCGTDYCVGVGNGLDALVMALKGLGVGAGDEVIVPSNTYIATALAVENDMLPPTINYETPDEGLDLDYVPNKAKAKTVRAAISNNFGFGGHNACLVLKKYAK